MNDAFWYYNTDSNDEENNSVPNHQLIFTKLRH